MTLDEFLERFVEGYLFGDLRSMAPIKPPDGQYGGVGYPMVMTALAGVELLGVLTSDEEFSPHSGRKRFREFWQSFLYPSQPARQEMAPLVYQLVRHGLAHTYMTKPVIEVTKAYHGEHLCRTQRGSIILDALTLADELSEAYTQRLKPKIKGRFKDKMVTRFGEVRKRYHDDHVAEQTTFARVPLRAVQPPHRGSVWAPNSPGLPATYSTNFSSKPTDKI